ncbi:glycosyltransferase family 2 protein [Butyrivibrio sp. WCD2001]|uniref:glycosyltransferase family 2 protein n=1 Tax=Butyrivibrio sp. WCD2001 TaxID=1280681 RepID=UPI00047DE177|nr:glycosyltransferase [Butyrivibrio sp. WCD2001]
MENIMNLSIIMPVYNGEKYLSESVGAILNNSDDSFELIIVNDGSIDSSKQICLNYALHDKRVDLINQENKGICSARNAGIGKARGRFILFVDQDDSIVPGAIDRLCRYLATNDSDMIIGGKTIQCFDVKGRLVNQRCIRYRDGIITKDNIYRKIFDLDCDLCLAHIWNCVYKTELIKRYKIMFSPELKMGHEDTLFNLLYANKCNMISLVSDHLYIYRRRDGQSVSMKKNMNYISDLDFFMSTMYESLSKCSMERYAYLYGLRIGYSWFFESMSDKTWDVQLREIKAIKEICDKYKSQYTQYKEINSKKRIYIQIIHRLTERRMYVFLLGILYIKKWIVKYGKHSINKKEFCI